MKDSKYNKKNLLEQTLVGLHVCDRLRGCGTVSMLKKRRDECDNISLII